MAPFAATCSVARDGRFASTAQKLISILDGENFVERWFPDAQ